MVRKKILVIGMVALMGLTVACSGGEEGEIINTALKARAAANKEQVDILVNSGLIGEDVGDGIKKSIDHKAESVAKALGDAENKSGSHVKASITWYINGTWSAGTDPSPIDTTITQYGKFPKTQKYNGSGTEYGVEDHKSKEETEPIEMVGEGEVEVLNDILSYDVYVLNSNNNIALDRLSIAVEKAKESDVFEGMDEYFKSSGEKLFDPKEASLIEETVFPGTVNTTRQIGVDRNEEGEIIRVYYQTFNVPSGGVSDLGKDLSIHQDGIPVVSIRLREFSPDNISKFIGQDGIAKDKYLVDTARRRVYLLEYPVYYVKKLKISDGVIDAEDGSLGEPGETGDGSEDGGVGVGVGGSGGSRAYEPEFEVSDILVNLVTGEIKSKGGLELKQLGDTILHLDGKGLQGQLGQTSFCVYGEDELTNIGYENKTIKAGRLVLRDYLELTHMKNVIQGENLVALGRRLRITNFEGGGSTEVAVFTDKNGKVIEEAPRVYIADIMDKDVGGGTAYKLPIGDNIGSAEEVWEEDGDDWGEDAGAGELGWQDETGYTQDKTSGTSLKTGYKSEITVGVRFPGEDIARADQFSGSPQKMVFYGLPIDLNPFTSALYSSWINKDDMDSGSLIWWNRWLSDNTFNYSINKALLEQFFMGNYSFEMRKEGFIILDIDAIKKIQEHYDSQDIVKRVRTTRTLFVILGLALIAYSTVLLASWGFDTNLISGPRLMSLMTAGRWEAIRESSDLPNMDTDNKRYMTFYGTVKGCAILIGIGILLISIDIIQIISRIMGAYEGIARVISSRILGY